MADVKIHLAFRYHVNYYHSYRGDSLDERGIGKDIRLITGILDDLDRLNNEDIPVQGTWDIENYYSLEKMMREHSPELISRIQNRVKKDQDEIELMSYNNGIISASTEEEFNSQISLSRSNEGQSGFDDLFDKWEPILRPQECMFTPSFLKRYSEAGIPCISMYYSAVPFNGFGSYVPPMDFIKRYNPLTLKSDGYENTMTLIPAYNHGDIADRWLSIRRWIKKIRRQQTKLENPQDVLLLIDMDADDEFWAGMDIPVLTKFVPSFDGFYRLVKSVQDLSYVNFTTPGKYIKDHKPVGEITINQDTADGSFDGYSSWAEKWENTRLWSLIQKSRDLEDYARYFAYDKISSEMKNNMDDGFHARLLALSTTHFGMASPVMNKDRLKDGFSWAGKSVQNYEQALMTAKEQNSQAAADHGAILLPRQIMNLETSGVIRTAEGTFSHIHTKQGERLGRVIDYSDRINTTENGIRPEIDFLSDRVRIKSGEVGWELMYPQIRYDSRIKKSVPDTINPVKEIISVGNRDFTSYELTGKLKLQASATGQWKMRLSFNPEENHIYIDMDYTLPETKEKSYNKAKAARLNRGWDKSWMEFMPAEIKPLFTGNKDSYNRIIKHNFFGDISSYEVNYGEYSKNKNVDNFNNHITNAWVGVSNNSKGLLITQHTGRDNNFAFCPMRCREQKGEQQITLNPFGTYHGRQLRYPTAVTGIGRMMALLTADQLDSYAPSFNGKLGSFSLMISPFEGSGPSDELKSKALLYGAAGINL
jgi:hypothetical protein